MTMKQEILDSYSKNETTSTDEADDASRPIKFKWVGDAQC